MALKKCNYIKEQTRWYSDSIWKWSSKTCRNFKNGKFIDGKFFEENGLKLNFFLSGKTWISWRHGFLWFSRKNLNLKIIKTWADNCILCWNRWNFKSFEILKSIKRVGFSNNRILVKVRSGFQAKLMERHTEI
jgi:hypothetical protein